MASFVGFKSSFAASNVSAKESTQMVISFSRTYSVEVNLPSILSTNTDSIPLRYPTARRKKKKTLHGKATIRNEAVNSRANNLLLRSHNKLEGQTKQIEPTTLNKIGR